MSKTTPDDLSVAFRSLPRRLSEATVEDTPPEAATTAQRELNDAVTAAATLLGSAATVEGVAAAIQERHIADWNDADLDALQTHANDAAAAIRNLERDRSGRADPDRW